MYKILIADDESIVRMSLRAMVDWESEGFEIAGDVQNGEAALAFMKQADIDILLTDIRMPNMDGIELLSRLSELDAPPATIVLSAYDDFAYVRQAFKLGAEDYLLKSDMTPDGLLNCVRSASSRCAERIVSMNATRIASIHAERIASIHAERIASMHAAHAEQSEHVAVAKQTEHMANATQEAPTIVNAPPIDDAQQIYDAPPSPAEQLKLAAKGMIEPQYGLFNQTYMIAGLEVDNWGEQVKRFGGSMEHDFVRPMISYAEQVPRLASKCHICSITPSRYVLLYSFDKSVPEPQETFASICAQVIRNWRNYMNVAASAGIGGAGDGIGDFTGLLDDAWKTLSLKFVLGRGGVYSEKHRRFFMPDAVEPYAAQYKALLEGIKNGLLPKDDFTKFTAPFYSMSKKDALSRVLGLLYYISIGFIEVGDDILYALDPNCNYYEKLERLQSVRDMEIWLDNMLRWFCDFVERRYKYKQADVIEKAKRFIYDHYCDPDISLAAVAGYAGLSEKYFSSRFNKETGQPLSAYINELRIAKAKELMNNMDMKVYEVCDAIGFNNVEHFTRVFKKLTGVTPSEYRQADYSKAT